MITIILLIIASASNAVMDVLFSFFNKSVFKNLNAMYWNPQISWQNKWKQGRQIYGEKFLGSSTFLVWTQDGWHLFKGIWLLSILGAIVAYQPVFNVWIDLGVFLIGWGIVFEFSIKLLKTK